jgi:hypothetical protein
MMVITYQFVLPWHEVPVAHSKFISLTFDLPMQVENYDSLFQFRLSFSESPNENSNNYQRREILLTISQLSVQIPTIPKL